MSDHRRILQRLGLERSANAWRQARKRHRARQGIVGLAPVAITPAILAMLVDSGRLDPEMDTDMQYVGEVLSAILVEDAAAWPRDDEE